MNHRDKLIAIHELISQNAVESKQFLIGIKKIPQEILDKINLIAKDCSDQKGLYTVLVTLLIHKILHPKQDVRFHQKQLTNGFAGRSVDTKYITPTLKSLGLPSVSGTGWLTRSLEQPFPYFMDYQGNIGGRKKNKKEIKDAFLSILDFLEVKTKPVNQQKIAELLIIYLLKAVMETSLEETITIPKVGNPFLCISQTIAILHHIDGHFIKFAGRVFAERRKAFGRKHICRIDHCGSNRLP